MTSPEIVQLPPTDIITPPCRLAFAHLFEKAPKSKGSPKLTYQCNVLVPPGTDLQPFSNALGAAMTEKWGQIIPIPAGKEPMRPAETKTQEDGTPYEGFLPGWFSIQCHSGYRPNVLNTDGSTVYQEPPMADDARRKAAVDAASRIIYSGCWASFHLRAFGWVHEQGGKGVSFGVEGVLKVRDDEAFGGKAHIDPHAAFGIAKPVAAAGAPAPGVAPVAPAAMPGMPPAAAPAAPMPGMPQAAPAAPMPGMPAPVAQPGYPPQPGGPQLDVGAFLT